MLAPFPFGYHSENVRCPRIVVSAILEGTRSIPVLNKQSNRVAIAR